MLLYTSSPAPNPRRVHIYLAEKGIEVPYRKVSLRDGEQHGRLYGEINADRTVPTLLLDDGTAVSESVAICRYFEARWPDPPLFGRNPREQALVEMWLRRLEIHGYLCAQDAYRNSRRGFAGRALPGVRSGVAQIPALVERSNQTMRRTLGKLDAQLARSEFVTGADYTMADIVGQVALDFGKRTEMEAVQDLSPWPHVGRWHAQVSARPSASATPL